MLSDEPIDEDLEALLYAQVYYGKEQDQLPDLTEGGLTEVNSNGKIQEESQVETTSEQIGSSKHFSRKKRYFENNLVQDDKEKENEDTSARKSNTEPLIEEKSFSETSILNSTIESSIETQNSEKFIQDQITPKQPGSLEITETEQHQFIEISSSTPSKNPSQKVVTSAPLLSSPNEPHQLQLLNNITINQYLYPPNFLQRLKSSTENHPLSRKCQRDLNRLKKGDIGEQEFFDNLKRRLKIQKKQHNQIRQAYLKKQKTIAESEVICLSDSDNSDIEVVDVTNISKDTDKKPLTMKDEIEMCMEKNENDVADDDEIIYVAPPPVPVINIDTESDSEASDKDKDASEENTVTTQAKNKEATSQNLPDGQLDVDETSNDFLQPKNTPENFNFSLHGSDFQNTEFLKPANPSDVYETESSTSTSDFNRDSSRQFCNSVKTIVFNEVEFPNQDIFDESNLESFGEFITPKRGDKEKRKEKLSTLDKSSNSNGSKIVNTRASSESSSESEYESASAHQNLPDLSPMVCSVTSPKRNLRSRKNALEISKRKKGKVEEDVGIKTRSSKRKSKEKLSDRNDGIIDVGQQANAEESVRKSKRKSCESFVAQEGTSRKKSKKKKKSGNKSAEENEVSEVSTSDRSVLCASPKKSLKDNQEVTSSTAPKELIEDEADSSSVPDESSKKKSKKKRKSTRNDSNLSSDTVLVEQQQISALKETEEATDDSSKRKRKKKKGKEASHSKTFENEETIDDQREMLEEGNEAIAKGQDRVLEDNGKKRNKRRKQRESSDNRIVGEASSSTSGENVSINTGKDEGGNSVNKSSGEQEILANNSGLQAEDEANSSKKRNKRRKQASSDKKSAEECNVPNDENKNAKDSEKDKDQDLEEGELVEIAGDEEKSNENVRESQSQVEEDIIIIEQVIPVHTIESSESDREDDIITFEGVGDDLELANISASKKNIDEVISNRDFDIDYVQSKMSDDPEKWKILPSDRYNLNTAKRGPRCKKCRQFGHIGFYCPNKSSLPICTLCGETGHNEPRCPNKVCFSCGKPGNYSTVYCHMCVKQRKDTCNLCSITGHKTDYCPDLWRRYFLTTTEGNLKRPKKNCPTLKPRNKQWCSGCASSGHLEFECNTYKWIREYPASSPNIFKYYDVYHSGRRPRTRVTKKPDQGGTAVEKFAADRLSRNPTGTPSRIEQVDNSLKDVVQRLESPEKRREESYSQENVTSTEEHRLIREGVAESQDRTVESQEVTEYQSTAEMSLGNQNADHPESNSRLAGPNFSQYAQPRAYLATEQMSYTSQSPFSRQRGRQKRKRKSPRNAKINPVSVLRQPMSYTPYQSVLNPYSLLGAPPPRRGLFNPVPNDILAKQLVDLANAVVTYQNASNFYGDQQFGAQIPPNPNPLYGTSLNAYRDFSEPIIPEPFYDIPELQNMYENREFLDRPYTITRDPTEDRESLHFQPVENRRREREVFAIDPIDDIERQFDLPSTRDNFRERGAYGGYTYRGGSDVRNKDNHFRGPDPDYISFEPPLEQRLDYRTPRNEVLRPPAMQIQRSNDFNSRSTEGENGGDRDTYRGDEQPINCEEVWPPVGETQKSNNSIPLTAEKDTYRGGSDVNTRVNRSTGPTSAFLSLKPPLEQRIDYRTLRDDALKHPGAQTQKSNDFISLTIDGDDKGPIFDKPTSKPDNIDVSIVKKFNSGSVEFLKRFISEDLEKLDGFQRADPKIYKRKLNSIDHLMKIEVKTTSVKKQIYFLYKQINMYLFGVHKLFEGGGRLEHLQNFVTCTPDRVSAARRNVLLEAYGYIFGGKHPDFNYRRYLNTMTVTNKN